jgi:sec-independent protein translocase protein TatA
MNTILAAFLGGWELIVVILAVLLLFGSKKIPELAKGLGSGIKEFKKAAREVTDEIQSVANAATYKPPKAGSPKKTPPPSAPVASTAPDHPKV